MNKKGIRFLIFFSLKQCNLVEKCVGVVETDAVKKARLA